MHFNSIDSAKLINQFKKAKFGVSVSFRTDNQVEMSIHCDDDSELTYNQMITKTVQFLAHYLIQNDLEFAK
jgi:hypothetical protein